MFLTKSQSCSKKLPAPFSMPNSFGSWPTMTVSASPMMNPLSTGSEMKFGDEPQPQDRCGDREQPDSDRERRRQLDVVARPLRGQVAHDRRRQRGRRRPRTDDELARATERRVQEQGSGRGVQPDDRRDSRNRCIRERLGHQHGPHGQARDEVARELGVRQRSEDRELHRLPVARSPEAANAWP
jgi:hypothetical protein